MIMVRETGEAPISRTGSGNIVHWLVGTEDGPVNFEMRKVVIPVGGSSSKGSHAHEHVVYVLSGSGSIYGDDGSQRLYPGVSVFVPGGEVHQWINEDPQLALEFLCIIPAGCEDFIK
jgi:quercetin dioxygenase-like cupin family protein